MTPFRHAHRYAPPAVTSVVDDALDAPDVALVVDIDTLDRSALARLDRVMLLALQGLARARVTLGLVARHDRARAALTERAVAQSVVIERHRFDDWLAVRRARGARTILLTDDPALLACLRDGDRGLALGRPELANTHIAPLGDTAVRATLWWMLETRSRASAA